MIYPLPLKEINKYCEMVIFELISFDSNLFASAQIRILMLFKSVGEILR